jgi:hypothetical protein
MAQDLVKISPELFELQLPRLNFVTLKQLYEACIQWKRDNGDKVGVTIPMSIYLSMERKQSKIVLELKRRSPQNKLGKDFMDWDHKLATKMKRTGR